MGIHGDQADDFTGDSGAVYVFRRTGTAWQQERRFLMNGRIRRRPERSRRLPGTTDMACNR
jgi:hypothetical protein